MRFWNFFDTDPYNSTSIDINGGILLDQLIKILPIIGGITSVFAIIALVIKSIAAFKASPLERVLQNEYQKLVDNAFKIFYSSIILSIVLSITIFFFEKNKDINQLLVLLTVFFITALIVIPFYAVVIITFLKKRYHLIKYPDPDTGIIEDYYLLKTMQNGDIIIGISRYDNDYEIIIKKDELYKMKIYTVKL